MVRCLLKYLGLQKIKHRNCYIIVCSFTESFEPTTDFERRVLGEFSSDPEAKKSSKEKNSGGAANIVESQKGKLFGKGNYLRSVGK